MLAGLAVASAGCGGTGVGNPVISIESIAYNNSAALWPRPLRSLAEWFVTLAYASPVSDFKFCVTKIKLTDAEDRPVTQGGSAEIEAILGLIDVSDAGSGTTWGSVSVPLSFSLKVLDVELHRDPERCSGAGYSIAYNGASVTKDLEFHFEFSPPVTVVDGDRLKLGLTNIATAIEQAHQAGHFTNEQISNYLTATLRGTGSK